MKDIIYLSTELDQMHSEIPPFTVSGKELNNCWWMTQSGVLKDAKGEIF